MVDNTIEDAQPRVNEQSKTCCLSSRLKVLDKAVADEHLRMILKASISMSPEETWLTAKLMAEFIISFATGGEDEKANH